ncbi:MAG: helix-turn-helix domain-containing protein [Lentisphaerae bacterium]|nr:helix-turn-helix domain-containing protein [Lentisphaerota bacterium]
MVAKPQLLEPISLDRKGAQRSPSTPEISSQDATLAAKISEMLSSLVAERNGGNEEDKAVLEVIRDALDDYQSQKHANHGLDDGWMTVEQAAEHIGLSEKAVRSGARRGTLPGCKYPQGSIRGRWRFQKHELDSWIKRGRPKPTKVRKQSIW